MQILKELQEVDYFIIFCVKTCQRDHLETTYVDHFTLKFFFEFRICLRNWLKVG